MIETQLSPACKKTRAEGCPIKRVAENGEAAFRCVDADLVGAPGERLGIDQVLIFRFEFGIAELE